MITDDEIKNLANEYAFLVQIDDEDTLAVPMVLIAEFSRRLIAKALEVRPLAWFIDEPAYLKAIAAGRSYRISWVRPDKWALEIRNSEGALIMADDLCGVDEAKQVALADFAKRTLQNLVHGGGE